ncbi:hypothetical protein DL89DRAFT_255433 [Linderina pennispora]|uniref:Peptidase S1 domain-containing protein n=1 Tax=Linderina pennispora TaxID=61395 RepID=A0A1Y1WIK8_9FUNG|nr:uncharacterized protein DL89DRAFT_255433 [Linderina pennispora]ORX73333.1 hypothetical protein DL89DRAFT_255433 [Linderina pennispora]
MNIKGAASALSLLFLTTNALNSPLVKRETTVAQINKFHGGVLLIDGKQTSCELALLSNRQAFVSASCINLDKRSEVDDITRYQAALDAGGSPPNKEIVNIDKIVVNPQYQKDNYVSNLAIVFFNSQSKEKWTTPSSRNGTAQQSQTAAKIDEGCEEASVQYASNRDDLWCSTATIPSPVNGTCAVPYGVVYGLVKSDIAFTALYSHSAVYGNNSCGSATSFHYYIVLANFLEWANTVVTESDPNILKHWRDCCWSMQTPTSTVSTTSTGNDDSDDDGLLSVESSSATNGSQQTGDAQASHSSDTLKKGQIHCYGFALFFLYKRWQRHKKTVSWDPNRESATMRAMALDLGQPEIPTSSIPAGARPPTYVSTDGEEFTFFSFARKG